MRPENLSLKQVLDSAKNITINIQVSAYHLVSESRNQDEMREGKGENEQKEKRVQKINRRKNEGNKIIRNGGARKRRGGDIKKKTRSTSYTYAYLLYSFLWQLESFVLIRKNHHHHA